MSEKRFTWDGDILFDNLELRELGNCLEARDIADLLNEQQNTITELNQENEQLKRKLKDCEHEHFLDGLGSSNKWFGMGGF